jgi:asparaginyl-tRNA synthetase
MPNVGEIVDGSMRMEGYEELMEAFGRYCISPKGYEFYADQK